jgi:DNA-damage-inducible protein D
MTDDQALLPFEGNGRLIRRQWHEGRWFFSVVDVVGLLTDSERPRKYWSDLKAKLREEGFDELSAKIGQLKMRSLDGKQRVTDAADAETLLRIVQSIPSPRAEPVKQWLAKVATERLEEIASSDLLAGLSEDQRRLFVRGQLQEHNRQLADAAAGAGVVSGRDFAMFQDWGYRGLYAGETARDIAARKGLRKGQAILDHMGSEELAANLFRATQTEAKLRREDITGKAEANRTHHEVGRKVRQTIADLGGTPPEKLPTPAQSIHELQRREQKRLEGEQQPSLFSESDEGEPQTALRPVRRLFSTSAPAVSLVGLCAFRLSNRVACVQWRDASASRQLPHGSLIWIRFVSGAERRLTARADGTACRDCRLRASRRCARARG